MRGLLCGLLAVVLANPAAAQSPAPTMQLWRLDCGLFDIKDLEGRGPYAMPVSCYLVRHGSDYLLFDAGLPTDLIGKPEVQPEQTLSLERSIADQLSAIGRSPSDVSTLVVSHYHGDHHGQAGSFAGARLLAGKADADALRGALAEGELIPTLAPWLRGERPMTTVEGEHDVFGDGRVIVLPSPGHTKGHLSLLVRLDDSAYILSGDAVHLRSQYEAREASANHVDKEQALRTIDRLKALERESGAKLVVGHDRGDVALLPMIRDEEGK